VIHVKGYSERSILAILNACTESHRLTARDAKWNDKTRSITSVTQLVSQGFVDRMAQRDTHILLPEVMRSYSKSEVKSKKSYSDAAKEEVAKGYKFKNKPGYNPNPMDTASSPKTLIQPLVLPRIVPSQLPTSNLSSQPSAKN
jgi:hypothetical protein